MPFCIKCAPALCPNSGIISINMSSNSSARPVDPDSCNPTVNPVLYIPGPTMGNITIQAYAFNSISDKWGGVRCKGTAQASQTNIQKYDSKTDTWYTIPSKIHKAQITGGLLETTNTLVTMGKTFFTGEVQDSQILNGISLTTTLTTKLGADFAYIGSPIAISIPEVVAFKLNLGSSTIESSYINSISVSVEYPLNPAVVSYTFDFPVTFDECVNV